MNVHGWEGEGVETRGAGAGEPSQLLHNWMDGAGMYVCTLYVELCMYAWTLSACMHRR